MPQVLVDMPLLDCPRSVQRWRTMHLTKSCDCSLTDFELAAAAPPLPVVTVFSALNTLLCNLHSVAPPAPVSLFHMLQIATAQVQHVLSGGNLVQLLVLNDATLHLKKVGANMPQVTCTVLSTLPPSAGSCSSSTHAPEEQTLQQPRALLV